MLTASGNGRDIRITTTRTERRAPGRHMVKGIEEGAQRISNMAGAHATGARSTTDFIMTPRDDSPPAAYRGDPSAVSADLPRFVRATAAPWWPELSAGAPGTASRQADAKETEPAQSWLLVAARSRELSSATGTLNVTQATPALACALLSTSKTTIFQFGNHLA